jgi:hypothetical protein
MIGKNNAGKSTVVEALRLLGLACARLATISTYVNRPEWLSDIKPLSIKGFNLSSRVIDIDLDQVFHRYGNPPAVISAHFSNSLCVEVFINSPNELFVVVSSSNSPITSKAGASEAGIPNLLVLPQIVPLSKEESYVTSETLSRNKFSKRTSGNFRSEMYVNKNTEAFRRFEEIIADTWHGIKVQLIERNGNTVTFNLRDRDFVTEIYHMGHGVQMWLQTMWFIAKAGTEAIIILDEPDVYMHADLQRKLIRLLRGQYSQTIIATHSIEIMTEVQPDEILIINRFEEQSIFADSYPAVQAAISGLGSAHNINLSRILNTKKYLYVEGEDRGILRIFWDTLFPRTLEPLDHIAGSSTGGWGSWETQKNNAKELMRELKGISIYFLYDRDMHTNDEINERINDAKRNNIQLHIWQNKEIENYLLIPTAIARFINKKNKDIPIKQLSDEIKCTINELCEELKDTTFMQLVDEAAKRNKHKKGYQTLHAEMWPGFLTSWADDKVKIGLIDGSTLFSRLSQSCKARYGVSFSDKQIASTMSKKEISPEIQDVLTAIHEGRAFVSYPIFRVEAKV